MTPPAKDIDGPVAEVCRRRADVISAYLFGSSVHGRTHRDSDLDLAVLVDWSLYPTSRERFDARLAILADFAVALHRDDIDLVVLNDAPPHLARAIVTGGRRLVAFDRDADHAFVRTAMLRAADITPFLDRSRRAKLAAIGRAGRERSR